MINFSKLVIKFPFYVEIIRLFFHIVVILLLSASVRNRFPFSTPSLFGSMKILSLYGEDLVYSKQLQYLGNYEAAYLRRKLEPKVSLRAHCSAINVLF